LVEKYQSDRNVAGGANVVENRRFENPSGVNRKRTKKADEGRRPWVVGLRSAWDLVFHAKAGAFKNYGFGVMEEPIQDRGSDRAVIVEDAGLLFEWFIGRQQDGAAFIALADDLEEQVSAVLVDR
jgi:hypothetical protein